jgi:hypothetical protein
MSGTDGKEHEGGEALPTLEEYLSMNESERDREIEKGLVRLQKRIQEILYFLETEKNP